MAKDKKQTEAVQPEQLDNTERNIENTEEPELNPMEYQGPTLGADADQDVPDTNPEPEKNGLREDLDKFRIGHDDKPEDSDFYKEQPETGYESLVKDQGPRDYKVDPEINLYG